MVLLEKEVALGGPDGSPSAWDEAASFGRARRLGWIAYGALAAGAVLYVITIWLEVYLDTRKITVLSLDPFDESHRYWRVRTAGQFLMWSVLGGFAVPLGIGWFVLVPAYIWYILRILIGMIWFARGRPMPLRASRS